MTRVTMSTNPPGGNPARIVSGRSGYCAEQSSVTPSAKRAENTVRIIRPPSPGVLNARFLVVEVFLDMLPDLDPHLVSSPPPNQFLPPHLHRPIPHHPATA